MCEQEQQPRKPRGTGNLTLSTVMAWFGISLYVADYAWLALAGPNSKLAVSLVVQGILVYGTPFLCAAIPIAALIETRTGRANGRLLSCVAYVAVLLVAWLCLSLAYVQTLIDIAIVRQGVAQ